jgi:prophage antirepressor-like protein
MSAIIPFQFEAHAVRVQVDDAGLPWFNASDVCDALEMGNPSQAIKSHVDADDLQKLEVIDNLGRTQRANHVNESGLYALILGSTKDAAKRFKRWVTGEVLPAIRKTGAYSAPGAPASLPAPTHDRVSAILLIGEAVAKVSGVKTGIAMAATLTCIQENTGLTTEVLRRALPAKGAAANEPICSLNATQLGKLLNRSAKTTNQLLAAGGLQFRNDRDEWELTEAGEAWAEAMPYSRNGHSGYQILWNPAVAEELKEVA